VPALGAAPKGGSLAELGDEPGAQARCTIDILVRNLFERTADVGFLATDDVILLAPNGTVLARLADDAPLERSTDPLVAEAIGSHTCRERFAPTDLVADGAPSLLYANRIAQADGRPIGVLVSTCRSTARS